MQTSTATAPAVRINSLDAFIRQATAPVEPAFTKSVRFEREAVMAAAARGDALSTVFAGFSSGFGASL